MHLVLRPGELITIMAGTLFAIPPGPTRAQRASASSGVIGRGSQPGGARRTSSTWMKTRPCSSARRTGGATGWPTPHCLHEVLPRACDPEPCAGPSPCNRPEVARPVRARCRVAVHERRDGPPDRWWTNPRTTWARRDHARRRGRRGCCVLAGQGWVVPWAHSKECARWDIPPSYSCPVTLDAVVFDLDDTLIFEEDVARASLCKAVELLGVESGRADEVILATARTSGSVLARLRRAGVRPADDLLEEAEVATGLPAGGAPAASGCRRDRVFASDRPPSRPLDQWAAGCTADQARRLRAERLFRPRW